MKTQASKLTPYTSHRPAAVAVARRIPNSILVTCLKSCVFSRIKKHGWLLLTSQQPTDTSLRLWLIYVYSYVISIQIRQYRLNLPNRTDAGCPIKAVRKHELVIRQLFRLHSGILYYLIATDTLDSMTTHDETN